jgi:hypothetical protein
MFRSRALEGKNYVFGLRKTVYSQKNSYIHIYIYIYIYIKRGGKVVSKTDAMEIKT